MLSHRRMFRGKSVADRLKQSTKIEPPSAVNPELPADLDPLVLRALRPKPADRQRTAAELRDALLDYMHEHGLRAGRSQVAQALFDLFDLRAEGGVVHKPWEADIRALGGEGLARPPRQRQRRPTKGRISTTVAQVGLNTALRRVRRRRRARIILALIGLIGVVALIALGFWFRLRF